MINDDQIKTLVGDGKIIVAIKTVRNSTGWGLRESKDYVDKIRDNMKKKKVRNVRRK